MISTCLRKIRTVSRQDRPVRFVVGTILGRSGLCQVLKLKIHQEGFDLHFFPTTLSTSLWIDRHDRHSDEDFLHRYLRPGDLYVDVGANVGSTTLAARAAVGPTGEVIAIEANPRTYDYLVSNLRLNKADNVKAINMGIGASRSELRFSDGALDDQNHVVDAGEGIPVQIDTLDTLLAGSREISLLKIDIEGYELFAFQGAVETLARTPCVYFESFEQSFRRYHYGTQEVLALLAQQGFIILRRVGSEGLAYVAPDHLSTVCENLIAVKSVDELLSRTHFKLVESAT
jgi:FkbM family methyltransferase